MTTTICIVSFLSTLSLRRATFYRRFRTVHNAFLSTLSLRRATREPTALRTPHHRFLSTLSLRRATQQHLPDSTHRQISIHALLAESDHARPIANTGATKFLSTLSLRRATCIIDIINDIVNNFYPRSPCGERPVMDNIVFVPRKFLSTLSLRRATAPPYNLMIHHKISIHALLAESDVNCSV